MLMDDDLHHQSEVDAQPCSVMTAQVEHILVVDDDSTQTEILSHLLSKQGYRVSTAKTCREGFEKVATERFDLILLDISMPDGSGLSMCSDLSDTATTADVPIIIVSGREEAGIVRKARAAGCHYYVRKPYDPNALLLLIQNSIAESREWHRPGV